MSVSRHVHSLDNASMWTYRDKSTGHTYMSFRRAGEFSAHCPLQNLRRTTSSNLLDTEHNQECYVALIPPSPALQKS